MYTKHNLALWVWIPMFIAGFCLFVDTATGDPLIITVGQATLADTRSSTETMARMVENGVEVLEPKTPPTPTGLDEQLAFVPEPVANKQVDSQLERRSAAPRTPPQIIVDRWQPGVYSNIDVDRRRPGSVPPIIVHRWPFSRTSLTIAQRWPFARTSLTVAQRWPFARSSLIIVHGIGS